MGYIILITVLILYFIPALVAQHRHKKNLGAIFVLNLFLGWTLIGWVVALVWASAKDENPVVVQSAAQPDVATQLEKLVELKNNGALTDEEFEKQKQRIL